MTTDPWATPESEPVTEPAAPPATTPAKTTVGPLTDNHGVTVSFKGGPGYDAPMIALRANDAADMLGLIGGDPAGKSPDGVILALMERVANGARFFSSKVPSSAGGGNGSQSAAPTGAPAGQPAPQEAPGGKQEFCSHGAMQYRDAVSKAGKAYKGFFCPERDRNAQCEPKFLR